MDYNTVLVFYALITLTSSIFVFDFYKQNRKRFKGILFIFLDYLGQILGLFLTMFRPDGPVFITYTLASTLIVGGNILFLFGISSLIKKRLHKKPYILFLLMFFVVYFYVTVINPNTTLRMAIYSMTIVMIGIETIRNLRFNVIPIYRKYTHATNFIVVLLTGIYFLRFYLVISSNFTQAMDGLVLTGSLVLTLSLTFATILMVNRLLYASVEEMATTDGLTGCYNRKKVEEILDAQKVEADHTNETFSLMMLDIDDFKSINDQYGHLIGDEVLKTFTEIIKNNIRGQDYLGRVGGDEFIIIFPGLDMDASHGIAEKLLMAVNEGEFSKGITGKTSIGIADYMFGTSIEATIKKADEALYRAKTGGKNRISI